MENMEEIHMILSVHFFHFVYFHPKKNNAEFWIVVIFNWVIPLNLPLVKGEIPWIPVSADTARHLLAKNERCKDKDVGMICKEKDFKSLQGECF